MESPGTHKFNNIIQINFKIVQLFYKTYLRFIHLHYMEHKSVSMRNAEKTCHIDEKITISEDTKIFLSKIVSACSLLSSHDAVINRD